MSSISSIHGAMDGKFLKTLTVGKPNFATGKIRIDGTTSGRVTITTAAAAGTWTLTLPSTGGTADYVLSTDGAGAASWISGQSIAGLKTTSTPQFLRLGLNQAADAVASLAATQTAIGVTSTDGYVLQNTTAAAAGAQQFSPRMRLTGQGWKTNATAASQTVDWIVENQPVQGAANPTTNLVFSSQVNAAGYVTQLTLQSGINALFAGTGQMTRLGLGAAADATYLLNLGGALVHGTATGVGIGTTGPATPLHVSGASVIGGDGRFNVRLDDTTAFASGVGPGIQFVGKTDAGGTLTGFASMKGIKENATSANTAGALVFNTNPNAGSNTERMRIDSAGNVTIGSTTVTSMFNVGTSAQFQVSSTGAISTTSVGPHAIGGATDLNVQWDVKGTLSGLIGQRMGTTINVTAADSGRLLAITGTLVEASSGTHPFLAGIVVVPSITGGVATTTDVLGIDILSITAAAGTTTATGLRVTAPTGGTTNYVQQWLNSNGTQAGYWQTSSSTNLFVVGSINLGNNVAGPSILSGQNSSGGAEGTAAGTLNLQSAAGGSRYYWTDNSASPGKLRVNTAAPTGSAGAPTVSDTAGTVVGDQTSWYKVKNVIHERTDPETALQAILNTKVYDFAYKSDSYLTHDNRTPIFTGVVIYDADREQDAWFGKNYGRQQEPSLNEINLHGYTLLAIKALERENQELRTRVAILERAT